MILKKCLIYTILFCLISQVAFAEEIQAGKTAGLPPVAAVPAIVPAVISKTQLPDDGIIVESTLQKVEAKAMNEKLSGYLVTVENHGQTTINLMNTAIPNGMNGQQAYEFVKRNTAGRALGWGIGIGLLSLGLGLLIAAPIAAATGSHANTQARNAGLKFDNYLATGVLPPGGSIQTYTFVPLGTKPQVKLTYKPDNASEIKFLSKS